MLLLLVSNLPCISVCKISGSQIDPLREAKRITEKTSHVIATQYYSDSFMHTDKWRFGLKHEKCCERLRWDLTWAKERNDYNDIFDIAILSFFWMLCNKRVMNIIVDSIFFLTLFCPLFVSDLIPSCPSIFLKDFKGENDVKLAAEPLEGSSGKQMICSQARLSKHFLSRSDLFGIGYSKGK